MEKGLKMNMFNKETADHDSLSYILIVLEHEFLIGTGTHDGELL
jgi:hypothetical protein